MRVKRGLKMNLSFIRKYDEILAPSHSQSWVTRCLWWLFLYLSIWQEYFTIVTKKNKEKVKTGLGWQQHTVVATPEQIRTYVLGIINVFQSLTHRNWRSLYLILLLAEELTAIPAVVPSFCERKPHWAARTAVTSFILHPVVSSRTAWLVTHRPAENSASTVSNEDPAVIPAGDAT